MTIVTDENMGIVIRPPTRTSHVAQPPPRRPISPRLRYVRNTNRIRSGEELQIRSLLARALLLLDDHIVEAAGLDVRSVLPVRPSDIVAHFVVRENGRIRPVGLGGTVVGRVESDGDAYGRVVGVLADVGDVVLAERDESD